MDIEIKLNQIGLTNNESKIYLALRTLGFTTTGPLIKKTKIHASKIYEGLNRLIDKGLATYITKSGTKYFQAVEPERLFDLIEKQKEELKKQEETIKQIIPYLNSITKISLTSVEVFQGWRGMETVYSQLRNTLKKGEYNYVFGASKGEEEEKTRDFFNRHLNLLAKKKIKQKIIYNEYAKGNIEEQYKYKKLFQVKYLPHTTPTEVNIWGDYTMIIILKAEPIVILIKDKETAESFKSYFNALWKLSKR